MRDDAGMPNLSERYRVVCETVLRSMHDLNMRQADVVRESGLSDPTVRSFMTCRFRGEPKPHTIRQLESALLWPPGAIARMVDGEPPDRVIETAGPPTGRRLADRVATLERETEVLRLAVSALQAVADAQGGDASQVPAS